MNILERFPKKKVLLKWYKKVGISHTLKVNNHIHTPYSFSSFKDIPQAVKLAVEEDVRILGINDFFVCDGYPEFSEECRKHKVFPLFNIEFIGLNKQDQKNNIKVNDPNNPGRTYLSGKGLDFPQEADHERIDQVKAESQKHVAEMIDKLNEYFASLGYHLEISMDLIRSRFAKNLVRERHIATALRVIASESFENEEEACLFFTRVFDGKKPDHKINDAAAFENEIRSKLLKAGGVAYVEEDEKAFLEVDDIKHIILSMGGIPTYPLLLDDKNGRFTDFEHPREKLKEALLARGIYSIEFIPHRNSFEHLKDYANYFYENGFIISFGTEHNTPSLSKLTVDCRDNIELDATLNMISYHGAAVIAAHQYLRFKGEQGYVDSSGKAKTEERSNYELLGKAIISYYFDVMK